MTTNTRPITRSFVVSTIVAALTASAGCGESYPPIPESQRALVDDALSIMECAAIANPGIWSVGSPTGPWDQGEADAAGVVPCLRDMLHNDQIFAVDDEQRGRACRGGMAEACTRPDGEVTCGGDQIFIPQRLVPDTLVGGDGALGGLVSVLWHEGIHARQSDRFGDCGIAREVEGYGQQLRFTGWLGPQINLIDSRPPGSGPCTNSLDASGIDPCLATTISGMFPALDTSAPFPADACDDLRRIEGQLQLRNTEARTNIVDVRAAAASCDSVGSSTMGLRVASEDHPVVHQVFASGSVISRYAVEPDGSLTFTGSFDSGLDAVDDLKLMRNAAGLEHLVAAGRAAGLGEVRIWADSNSIEFPADGVFDFLASTMSDPAMVSADELIIAPDGGVMVWDVMGQRVFRLLDSTTVPGPTPGSDALPDAVDPVPVLQVPAGDRGYLVMFAPTEPLAGVSLDPDPERRSAMLHFADDDLDGVYTLVDETTALESDWVPPNFVGRPVQWDLQLPLAGAPNHVIDVISLDDSTTLASATVSPAGTATAYLSRYLADGERIQLKDSTTGDDGPTALADAWRPVVSHMSPLVVDDDGGDVVHIVGKGLTWTDEVKVGGSGVPFTILSDRAVDITVPPLTGPTSVTLSSWGTPTYVGVLRPTWHVIRFDDVAQWSAWSATTGGWKCDPGSYGSELPPSRDDEACYFAGEQPGWDELRSATIDLAPFQGQDVVIELTHRPSFGRGGDGGVLQALVGSTWQTLKPRGRPLSRIDSNHCVGLSCEADSPVHGQRGYAGGRASQLWLTDEFEVPAGLSSLQLRLAGTHYSDQFGDGWAVDRLDIRLDEGGTRTPPPSVPWQPIFDLECAVWQNLSQGFWCIPKSWLPGGFGAVLTFWGSYADATIPLDLLEVEEGHQVALHLRHRFDFDPQTVVDMSGGWLELCIGQQCDYIHPVAGYPYGGGQPGSFGAYTDRGIERTWMTDTFDLTQYAGTEAQLVLRAVSSDGQPPEGWTIDSIALEVR